MKNIHFYKAKSRLGVTNFLHHQKHLNIGVEDAPDYILTKDLLTRFPGHQMDECTFPKPEEVVQSEYYKVLAAHLENFKNLINQTLTPSQIQIVVGGDNSVTFASMLALLERIPNSDKIGYIQFDSHGEMNLHKTSPTKNFHGMYMRPFIDNFDVPCINKLIQAKFPVSNLLLIGNLDLDEEEKEFIKKNRIQTITKKDVVQYHSQALKRLVDFISNFDHLHINFDVDVFDQTTAPATGIPTTGGFTQKEVTSLLQKISDHPNLSLDLVEVNPRKEGTIKTIRLMQKVLMQLMTF